MRRSAFPWLLVTAGAVVFWTIALGFGVPSLAALLGEEGPAARVSLSDNRCDVTAIVDGHAIVFGDCINVRFVSDMTRPVDSPPAHTVSREAAAGAAVVAEPEDTVTPPMLDDREHDTIGRTAF